MEGRELRLTPLLHANMRQLGLSDQKLAWIGGQAKHIWPQRRAAPQEAAAGPRCARRRGRRFRRDQGSGSDRPLSQGGRNAPMADSTCSFTGPSVRAAMALLSASGWSGAVRGGVLRSRLQPLSRYKFVGVERNLRRSSLAAGGVEIATLGTGKEYGSARWPPPSKVGRSRSPLRPTTCSFCCVTRPTTISSGAAIGSPTSKISFPPRPAGGVGSAALFIGSRVSTSSIVDSKAFATMQAVTGRPRRRAPSRFWGPRADVARRVARIWEIGLRALRHPRPFDLKARSNGRKARGFAGDVIGRSLKPERAVALALEGQPLTAARTEHPRRFAVFPTQSSFSKAGGYRKTDVDGPTRTSVCSAFPLRSEKPASHFEFRCGSRFFPSFATG